MEPEPLSTPGLAKRKPFKFIVILLLLIAVFFVRFTFIPSLWWIDFIVIVGSVIAILMLKK
jgi:Flp pilus assembly protein TadB